MNSDYICKRCTAWLQKQIDTTPGLSGEENIVVHDDSFPCPLEASQEDLK